MCNAGRPCRAVRAGATRKIFFRRKQVFEIERIDKCGKEQIGITQFYERSMADEQGMQCENGVSDSSVFSPRPLTLYCNQVIHMEPPNEATTRWLRSQ
jgi:hypothetical protein